MNSKRSKNHQKIGDRQTGPKARQVDGRFNEGLASLRVTTSISKPAAMLARELLASVAGRCAKRLAYEDAMKGAMAATLLTAHASGMSRREFCDWLRDTAATLEVPHSKR